MSEITKYIDDVLEKKQVNMAALALAVGASHAAIAAIRAEYKLLAIDARAYVQEGKRIEKKEGGRIK